MNVASATGLSSPVVPPVPGAGDGEEPGEGVGLVPLGGPLIDPLPPPPHADSQINAVSPAPNRNHDEYIATPNKTIACRTLLRTARADVAEDQPPSHIIVGLCESPGRKGRDPSSAPSWSACAGVRLDKFRKKFRHRRCKENHPLRCGQAPNQCAQSAWRWVALARNRPSGGHAACPDWVWNSRSEDHWLMRRCRADKRGRAIARSSPHTRHV